LPDGFGDEMPVTTGAVVSTEYETVSDPAPYLNPRVCTGTATSLAV
jgi:hypothetical protein